MLSPVSRFETGTEVAVGTHTGKAFLAVIGLTLAVAAPSAAQGNDSGVLVGAGVTFLNDSVSTGGGFGVDVSKSIKSMARSAIGVVGDVGVNKMDGYTTTSFGGGVRVTGTSTTVMPYGQFRIGGEHYEGGNALTIGFGGGVDVPVKGNLNVRVAYDYWRSMYDDDVSYNNNRFFFGISTKLGG
jgi:hypothetical protein